MLVTSQSYLTAENLETREILNFGILNFSSSAFKTFFSEVRSSSTASATEKNIDIDDDDDDDGNTEALKEFF